MIRFDRFTLKAQEAVQESQSVAERHEHQAVDVEHLLYALISQSDGIVQPIVKKLGGNPAELLKKIEEELKKIPKVSGGAIGEAFITKDNIFKVLIDIRGTQRVTDQTPEDKYQALAKYSRDLTDLARKGKLDPVIGRDDEIRRVVQVLSRRTKNNPVLIGEPGVGKTAIVEGLAQRIVS